MQDNLSKLNVTTEQLPFIPHLANRLPSKDPPECITPRVTMSTTISAKSTYSPVDFASPWQAYDLCMRSHLLTQCIKSQNDYLREWQYKTEDYLDLLLRREGPPTDRTCSVCTKDGVYRCHSCMGEPLFCTHCCRTVHSHMPFHRISQWTGGFFEHTSLTKIGLEIHLGHQGKPCPQVTDEWYDTDDEGDNFTEGQWVPLVNDPRTTTVVDTSGLHSLMIRFCRCADALSPDMQLFRTGLFPASFTSPKTAFTFAVLDDFLLDNLECGTSAMNYYSKLRRITSSVFPHLVPVSNVDVLHCTAYHDQKDRYRELMRVGRQWRQLKQLKWQGFGHEKRKPKAGELALFCPACPQPGVNVNLAEKNANDPAWLYSRSLVMDGNFKAEHMFPANPSNEVALTDGLGFMVGDARYKMHLAEAQDIVYRSDCNNHRAVNQANASRHKLEATGIGGCACARHGCFVPHSMVDFQKGERFADRYLALPGVNSFAGRLKTDEHGLCAMSSARLQHQWNGPGIDFL